MADLVSIGFKADAKGIEEVNKGFDKVVASGGRADKVLKNTEKSITKFSGAAAKTTDKMSMFGRQSGQAGIQLQQFIGQVQGGQSAMLALSQQSADLGFVLGAPLLGAVVGISASIAGMLLPNLFKTTDALEDVKKIAKELDTVLSTSNGIEIFNKRIEELTKRSKSLARLEISSAMIDAEKIVKKSIEGISKSLEDNGIGSYMSDISSFAGDLGEFSAKTGISISSLGKETKSLTALMDGLMESGDSLQFSTAQSQIDALSKKFEISKQEAISLGIAFSTVKTDKSVFSVKLLENALTDINDASGGTNEAIAKLSKGLLPLFETTNQGVNKTHLLRTALGDLSKAMSESSDTGISNKKAIDALSASFKGQIIALRDGEEAAIRYNVAQSLGLASIEEIPEALSDQVTEIIRLTNAKKAETTESKLGIIAGQSQLNSLVLQTAQLTLTANEYEVIAARMQAVSSKASPEMVEAIDAQVRANQKLRAELKTGEVAVEDFTGVSEKAAERIEEVFADAWLNMFDGFDSVVDGMKNAFKRMLAEMAHEAFTKNILVNIGVGGQGAGGVAGIGTGDQFGSALAGMGGVFSGAGAYSNSAYGGAAMLGGMFGSTAGGAGDIGGAIGAAAGLAIGGPIGAAIGGALGGALGSLVGGNWETNKRELQVGVSGSDFSGGVFSEDKKKKLWKNRYRSSFEQIADAAFDSIFSSVTSSLSDAAALLDITEVTKTFSTSGFGGKFGMVEDSIYQTLETTITKPVDQWLAEFNRSSNIDIKGLSEEEVEQKLQDWIAQTTDAMIDGVFGQMLDGLKKQGESSADALDRVVGSFNLVNKMSELMSVNFDAVGEAGAIAATTISELAGGLESLTQLSNSYYQNFFSDEEKFLNLQEELTKAFAEMGVPLTTTKDGFRQLVESLDLTSEADQEMFAALMKLNPLMAQYTEILKSQQDIELSNVFAELEKAIEADNKRINLILDGAKDAYKAEVERINGVRDALTETFDTLTSNLDDAKSAMTSAFAGQKAAIVDASNMRIDGIRQEIDASREYHQAELEFLSAQKSAVGDMISGLSGASSNLRSVVDVDTNALSTDLAAALSAAQSGNFNPAMALGDISALMGDASQFSSAAQMRVSQGVTGFAANELANLVDNQLSVEERTLALLEQQTIDETARYDAEQSMLAERIEKENDYADAQTAALDAQLNNLLGINTGVLSVDASIIAFKKAQDELNSLDYERQLEMLAEQEEWAMEALDIAEQNSQDQIDKLDDILNKATNQINALYNINTSVLSVQEAIRQLQTTVADAETAQASRDLQIAKQTRKTADGIQQINAVGVQTEAIA